MSVKYLDMDGLLYFWQKVKGILPTKTSDLTNDSNYAVDASYVHTDTNFTQAEKTKLGGIEAGAEANVNADWNASTGDAAILNKPNIANIVEAYGYQTSAQVQSAISSAISDIQSFSYEVVSTLPATGETGVIYLVPHAHGVGDTYDEYVWIESSSSFEKIGHTDVDLSGYVLTSDLIAITNAEIDTISAT